MAPITERDKLIRKGRHERLHSLAEQGSVTLQLTKEYRDPLFASGMTELVVEELRKSLAEVQELVGAQAVAQDYAKVSTRKVEGLIDDSSDFYRIVRLAAPLALKAARSQLSAEVFNGGRLRRSTTRVLGYLLRVRPHIEQLDDQLKPYFRGESALARLDALVYGIANVNSGQELAILRKPDSTEKLHEAKGRLLEAIETVNRIGQIAFFDQPTMAARFNKEILQRGKRSRRKRKADAPAPPEPADIGDPKP